LSDFEQNNKLKILTSTRSLPANENRDSGPKFSRQQSLPGRRPNQLIRMNSDPKMLPSIELSLSKDNEMPLNELRQHFENCGQTKITQTCNWIGSIYVVVKFRTKLEIKNSSKARDFIWAVFQ
jgi:hypothetical protein